MFINFILGDSIYRQKYEKLKREMDFMKKKLEQQHEEEIEKKDAIKKQLERKVTQKNLYYTS